MKTQSISLQTNDYRIKTKTKVFFYFKSAARNFHDWFGTIFNPSTESIINRKIQEKSKDMKYLLLKLMFKLSKNVNKILQYDQTYRRNENQKKNRNSQTTRRKIM